MAGILSWRRWLDSWRSPPPQVKQEPAGLPASGPLATVLPEHALLAMLDTSTLEQSCLTLQREASLVQTEWQKNQRDQDNQLQAYMAAQGNEARQRCVAEERLFIKKIGRDLEARYHAIQKHVQLLNGIALLVRKQQWTKQHLSLDALAGMDLGTLQSHLARAVAQSEADDALLADMLNMLEATAEKAERRRNIAVQDELVELARLAEQRSRINSTVGSAETVPKLETISDELQLLLDRELNAPAYFSEKSTS